MWNILCRVFGQHLTRASVTVFRWRNRGKQLGWFPKAIELVFGRARNSTHVFSLLTCAMPPSFSFVTSWGYLHWSYFIIEYIWFNKFNLLSAYSGAQQHGKILLAYSYLSARTYCWAPTVCQAVLDTAVSPNPHSLLPLSVCRLILPKCDLPLQPWNGEALRAMEVHEGELV